MGSCNSSANAARALEDRCGGAGRRRPPLRRTASDDSGVAPLARAPPGSESKANRTNRRTESGQPEEATRRGSSAPRWRPADKRDNADPATASDKHSHQKGSVASKEQVVAPANCSETAGGRHQDGAQEAEQRLRLERLKGELRRESVVGPSHHHQDLSSIISPFARPHSASQLHVPPFGKPFSIPTFLFPALESITARPPSRAINFAPSTFRPIGRLAWSHLREI